MTDRKLTCVACKSAITEGDIAHSDLEFGGELKATNQPEYTGNVDTDVVATIGTLDAYAPMVRTTGNQVIAGTKSLSSAIVRATLMPTTVSEYTPATAIEIKDVDSKTLGSLNVAKGPTYAITELHAKSNVNSAHYAKLAIKISDNGKVDLILESHTSQGYDQHIIYTFGS